MSVVRYYLAMGDRHWRLSPSLPKGYTSFNRHKILIKMFSPNVLQFLANNGAQMRSPFDEIRTTGNAGKTASTNRLTHFE